MRSWSLHINQWMKQNALNALEAAHQDALEIKEIEEQHFGGRAIMAQPGMGKTVTDYFRTHLNRKLLGIRSNLLRFRLAGFWVDRASLSSPNLEPGQQQSQGLPTDIKGTITASEAVILEKLAFIESVVGKYRVFNPLSEDRFDGGGESIQTIHPEVLDPTDSKGKPTSSPLNLDLQPNPNQEGNSLNQTKPPKPVPAKVRPVKPKQPSGMSFFGGASTIGKEFNPQYEQEVVQELRLRRAQNHVAVRWLIILLLVPLLVQAATKNLFLEPILGTYSNRNPTKVELSAEITEEFLREFSAYREALEAKRLIAKTLGKEAKKIEQSWQRRQAEPVALLNIGLNEALPRPLPSSISNQPDDLSHLISSEVVEEDLQEQALAKKALELWDKARQKQMNGIKNILADGIALLTFIGLVFVGRQRLAAVQSFSNRAFLSLNDPTKVFLFILITDMFVGFHSAEGWEVILEGVAHHFGVPESKAVINGFIATVPVVIDSCIKFWIFTYLTRYSPSASAIYERMNT